MSHFAVISPPLFSHLQALRALAQALIRCGHRVTFIADDAAYPLSEALREAQRRVKRHSGGNLFQLIQALSSLTDILCQQLPAIVDALAVDALIVDQMEPAGGIVADALGLPFASVACALPVNREADYPLPVMPFRYADDDNAQRLYRTSERIYDRLMRPHERVIAHHAARFGLTPRHRLDHCLSTRVQIAQCIPALDFPRKALPDGFHYVGALREDLPLRGEKTPRTVPRVYASLGTLQGHRAGLFHKIAAACKAVGAQVMIAHCDGLSAAQEEALYHSGATWVRGFVDQPRFLRDADVIITHGGLNTVLEAVAVATPVLAMPVAFDQPAVAARVAWSNIGRRVSRFSTSHHLAKALEHLLSEPDYARRIGQVSDELHAAGGANRAASLIEQALLNRSTQRP
nr:glycosyltransferase [uncultured Enterobacter sp.]